jgi:hypothetical protein
MVLPQNCGRKCQMKLCTFWQPDPGKSLPDSSNSLIVGYSEVEQHNHGSHELAFSEM